MKISLRFLFACFAIVGSLFVTLATSSTANAKATICFYSPDTNINNLATLKQGFDTYLSSIGEYRFQPFADAKFLKIFSKKEHCDLYMLSYDYFQHNKNNMGLVKKLSGMLHGRNVQKKILSSKGAIANFEVFRNKKIASSSSLQNSKKMLLEILGAEHKDIVQSLEILEVPKDIDALMAISFGVAFAALTTGSSVELLMSINPKQAKKLKVTGGSFDAPLTVVASRGENSSVLSLLQALIKMPNVPEGKYQLKLLGLDKFMDVASIAAGEK